MIGALEDDLVAEWRAGGHVELKAGRLDNKLGQWTLVSRFIFRQFRGLLPVCGHRVMVTESDETVKGMYFVSCKYEVSYCSGGIILFPSWEGSSVLLLQPSECWSRSWSI